MNRSTRHYNASYDSTRKDDDTAAATCLPVTAYPMNEAWP